MRTLFCLLFAALISIGAFGQNTIHVTNGNDTGAGSLREALSLATTGATIKIDFSGQLDLTSPLIINTASLNIEGPAPIHFNINAAGVSGSLYAIEINATNVMINGIKFSGKTGTESFLFVNPGATATIENCHFENNNISGGGDGGAILNAGNLTVNRCSFSTNSADNGGAISNVDVLNVYFCSFHYCDALNGNGGAILSLTDIEIDRCTFFHTRALAGAGGSVYISGVTSFAKMHACLFDSTSNASTAGTEAVGASVGAAALMNGGDISDCMMLDSPANLNLVIFGAYNNSVGSYPTNIFGLRTAGVVTDGYGLQWIPVTNPNGTAIDEVSYQTSLVGPIDIRRGPGQAPINSFAQDIGAVENSKFTVTTTTPTGQGSIQNAISAINAAGQGPYLIDFDYAGWTPINLTSSLDVFIGSDELYIDGYTIPGSRVPGPTDGSNPVVHGITNVVLEGPSGTQNAINLYNVGPSKISGLAIGECAVGINNSNSQSLSNADIFGCHFGLDHNGNDNGKYCDTSIVVRTDYTLIGGDHEFQRNVFGGINGPAKPHIYVEGLGFTGTAIDGNFFGLDGTGTVDVNSGNGNIGIGLVNAGFGYIGRNLFGGLRKGIIVTGASGFNIEENLFGLDAWGTGSMPIEVGMEMSSVTSTNNIGGSQLQNYFCSANGGVGSGIYIANTNQNQEIVSNYFGLNTSFTPMGNQYGVKVLSSTNVHIGQTGNEVNFIAASSVNGIELNNSSNCIIQHTVLGLDTNGLSTAGVGNQIGIELNSSNINSIGVPGAPIWVSNSVSHGIELNASSGCQIQDANVGVDINNSPAGNGGSGIVLLNSSGTLVGGTGANESVTTAFSTTHGFDISGGSSNTRIIGDSVYSNGSQGIYFDDVTTIDNLIENTVVYDNGGSAEGITLSGVANNNVPRPSILGVSRCDGQTRVKVQFNNTVGNDAQIEFFRIPNGSEDPSGFGEGNVLLALIPSASIPTSHVQTYTLPDVPAGDYISCIVSYGLTNKSTSEFSNHSQVVEGPVSSLASSTNVSCFGGNDGQISVTISNGAAPLVYDWQDGGLTFATTQNVTGLSDGSYDLIVTDDVGCADTATYSVTQPASPVVVTLSGSTNVMCNGNSDGTIDINVTGGTPGTTPMYYFDWDNDGTGDTDDPEDLTGLSVGSYSVVAIDDNGCTDTLSGLIITEPMAISESSSVTSNYNGEDISCSGLSDGEITTNITGGVGPYTITYNGANPQNTLTGNHVQSGFAAGSYMIDVTDNNGCTWSGTNVNVTQPTQLFSNPSKTDVSCFGGSDGTVTAAATGGVPGYSYAWDSGLGAGQTHNSVTAGSYTVTVTDQNGCMHSDLVTVSQPATAVSVSVDAINDASCNGSSDGSILMLVSGGSFPYNYDWDNDGTGDNDDTKDLYSLPAGTYSLVVTDNNGCTVASGPYTINQPGPSSVNAGSDATICEGSSHSLNGVLTNISSGMWTGGIGTYTPSNTDMNATYTPDPSEAGTSIWIVLSPAGTCPTTADSMELTIEALPDAGADDAQSFCNDHATVDLDVYVTGSAGGNWYDPIGSAGFTPATGDFDPSSYSPGTYNFFYIVNGLVCANDSAEISVTVNPLPIVFAGNDTTVCEGSMLTLFGSGADSYSWTGGITDGVSFQVLANATYNVTGTNTTTGCQNTDQVEVFAAAPPSVDMASTSLSDPTCLGFTNGSITVGGIGGSGTYEYSINEGTAFQGGANFTGLGVGDYYLVVKDLVSGCTSVTDTVTLNPGVLVTHSVSITQPLCHDSLGTVNITFSGGAMPYDYTTDNASFTNAGAGAGNVSLNLADGEYYIQIQDVNGCLSVLDTHNVIAPAPITYDLTPTDICLPNLGSIEFLNITGGTGTGTYDFSSDNGTTWQALSFFNQLLIGTYQTSIIDANGCRHDSTVTVNFDGPPQPTINSSNPFCDGDDVLVSNGSSNSKWFVNNLWSGPVGTGASINLPLGVSTGDWIYVADQQTSGNFCYSIPDSLQIVVVNNTLTMGPDATVCPGDSAEISASFTGNGTFSWDADPGIGNTLSTITNVLPNSTQNYYVAKLSNGGCTFTDSLLVIVDESGDCGLEISNAFSPDGDGVNDQWIIEAVIDNPINEVYIYNRWGDQIEHFTNYDNSSVVWDPGNTGGTANSGGGQAVTNGTYFYVIEFPETNVSRTGWVQITR